MGELYKRGKIWWADYVDKDGTRVRKTTKMRDKQNAQRVLDSWEIDEKMIEAGVRVRTKAREALEAVLVEYETTKRTAGKSVQHVDRTGQLVRAVASHNEWTRLGDISPEGIAKYADHLRKDERQAARTIASMITAIRGFCRWCVRTGKLYADPTATLVKPSSKNDRRIERRMLLPDEWQWLKKYLDEQATEERNGQPPSERLLMYRVAIETGLRSSELRSLIRSSMHLGGQEPYIRVKASVTKNSQMAKQYLSDELAGDLTKRLASKMASAAVFNVRSRNEMARTLRKDISDARKLWLSTLSTDGHKSADSDFLKSPNSQGEVLDFHALRHTCGAWLTMQGVTLAEVREIMRHSTITLTVDCYGHLAPDCAIKKPENNRRATLNLLDTR